MKAHPTFNIEAGEGTHYFIEAVVTVTADRQYQPDSRHEPGFDFLEFEDIDDITICSAGHNNPVLDWVFNRWAEKKWLPRFINRRIAATLYPLVEAHVLAEIANLLSQVRPSDYDCGDDFSDYVEDYEAPEYWGDARCNG